MRKKSTVITFIVLLILVSGAAYLTMRTNSQEVPSSKIPVVYPVTVDALQKVGQGIKDEGIDTRELSAEGDATKFSTVIDSAISDSPPIVVTIGTQMANTIFGQKYDSRRPIVIASAISDPSKLEIPENFDISIISDNPNTTPEALEYASKQYNLPIRNIGILANQSEKNSIGTAKIAEDVYRKLGSDITYGYLNSASDVVPVTKTLLSKNVSMIVIPHDKFAVGNASAIVKAAMENNPPIPVISLDDGTVEKHGVLLGISADYRLVGSFTGKEVKKVLSGMKPKGKNIIYPDVTNIVINEKTAQTLNINISGNKNSKFNSILVK